MRMPSLNEVDIGLYERIGRHITVRWQAQVWGDSTVEASPRYSRYCQRDILVLTATTWNSTLPAGVLSCKRRQLC